MSTREAGGRRLRGGRHLWGAAATAVALLTCYGATALLAILSLLGLGVALDEGVWAATIAFAAVAAGVFIGLNMRRHGRPWPVLMAGLGAALVLYAMLGVYDPVTEGLGFLALVAAAITDLVLLRRMDDCAKR